MPAVREYANVAFPVSAGMHHHRAARAQAAREKRRLRYEQRMQRRKARLQQCPAAEKVKKPSEQYRKSRKEFEKNEQKQLQTAARVYYNNL